MYIMYVETGVFRGVMGSTTRNIQQQIEQQKEWIQFMQREDFCYEEFPISA